MGMTEQEVCSTDDTVGCLTAGANNRTTGATAMNAHSSRSHAIFTIHVERRSKKQEYVCFNFLSCV